MVKIGKRTPQKQYPPFSSGKIKQRICIGKFGGEGRLSWAVSPLPTGYDSLVDEVVNINLCSTSVSRR